MAALKHRKQNRYIVDLIDLHGLCELNYACVLQVFPDYEQRNRRELIAGSTRVVFDIIERCRYTTRIRLQHTSPLIAAAGAILLELRLYHDARMAEIAHFQSHRGIAGRYSYPNPSMYQRDEKMQQNQYLAEVLAFCLSDGRSTSPVSFQALRSPPGSGS